MLLLLTFVLTPLFTLSILLFKIYFYLYPLFSVSFSHTLTFYNPSIFSLTKLPLSLHIWFSTFFLSPSVQNIHALFFFITLLAFLSVSHFHSLTHAHLYLFPYSLYLFSLFIFPQISLLVCLSFFFIWHFIYLLKTTLKKYIHTIDAKNKKKLGKNARKINLNIRLKCHFFCKRSSDTPSRIQYYRIDFAKKVESFIFFL